MKPRSKDDWIVMLDAIEAVLQFLRSASAEEIQQGVARLSAPPQSESLRAALEDLLDAIDQGDSISEEEFTESLTNARAALAGNEGETL